MSTPTLEQFSLKDLSSAPLWGHFLQLTQIPRPSGHEEGVRQWIRNLAEKHGRVFKEDAAGNVVVYVPGCGGQENRPPLILQNHMDMVCDHTPEHPMNFKTDPLTIKREGDWLMAQGSTLGSDNGIGLCAALSLVTAKNTIAHPPLEILFTVDEETGLHGALNLDPELLSAKRLLNLDTEEWGAVYVGCAGGKDWEFRAKLKTKEISSNKSFFKLTVLGLKGGHSGVDIHLQRGNALKILAEILHEGQSLGLELAQIQGGRAHNIIPRDAWAVIAIEEKNTLKLQKMISDHYERLISFLPEEDQDLEFSLDETTPSYKLVLEDSEAQRILSFLQLFPHGAHKFERQSSHELVSLSSNLAKVILEGSDFYVQSSLRFLNPAEMATLTKNVEVLANSFQLTSQPGLGYPSWKPVFNNPLLETVKKEFAELHGQAPAVKAIHAGLECGIIQDKLRAKLGGIDMVSFGPTIENAHSPSERVNIPTVEHFWSFFLHLLSRL